MFLEKLSFTFPPLSSIIFLRFLSLNPVKRKVIPFRGISLLLFWLINNLSFILVGIFSRKSLKSLICSANLVAVILSNPSISSILSITST